MKGEQHQLLNQLRTNTYWRAQRTSNTSVSARNTGQVSIARWPGAGSRGTRCESNQPINDPVKLIAPMLARFMATDAFCQGSPRREHSETKDG